MDVAVQAASATFLTVDGFGAASAAPGAVMHISFGAVSSQPSAFLATPKGNGPPVTKPPHRAMQAPSLAPWKEKLGYRGARVNSYNWLTAASGRLYTLRRLTLDVVRARQVEADSRRLHLLRQLGEAVEGLGVCQGVAAGGLVRRGAGEDLFDRHLELLAVQGLRDVSDREDLVRDVARGSPVLDGRLDLPLEVVVEFGALLQDDEEGHKRLAAVLRDVHDEAVGDLFDPFHGGVDLAGPHPHAAAVDRGVASARDYAAAVLFD